MELLHDRVPSVYNCVCVCINALLIYCILANILYISSVCVYALLIYSILYFMNVFSRKVNWPPLTRHQTGSVKSLCRVFSLFFSTDSADGLSASRIRSTTRASGRLWPEWRLVARRSSSWTSGQERACCPWWLSLPEPTSATLWR